MAVIVSATSSITTSTGYNLPITVAALVGGISVLFIYFSRSRFAHWLDSFIEKRLVKSHLLEEAATEDLLHLIEGYGMVRVVITQDSPIVGQSLKEVNMTDNEFWVVGIERGKDWISLPRSVETIKEDDKLIVYGNLATLKSIFKYS